MQIPKKTDNLTVFFALLGSARTKAALTMLMKLTLALSFADHQWFYFLKRQKGKKDEKLSLPKKQQFLEMKSEPEPRSKGH
jgi:hypothetical protein